MKTVFKSLVKVMPCVAGPRFLITIFVCVVWLAWLVSSIVPPAIGFTNWIWAWVVAMTMIMLIRPTRINSFFNEASLCFLCSY